MKIKNVILLLAALAVSGTAYAESEGKGNCSEKREKMLERISAVLEESDANADGAFSFSEMESVLETLRAERQARREESGRTPPEGAGDREPPEPAEIVEKIFEKLDVDTSENLTEEEALKALSRMAARRHGGKAKGKGKRGPAA